MCPCLQIFGSGLPYQLCVASCVRWRCPHLTSPPRCPCRRLLLWLEYHFLWPCCLKRHISINQCDSIGSSGCQVSSWVCSKWLWYCTAYSNVLFSPPFSLSFLDFGSLQWYGGVDAEYCWVKWYTLLVGCKVGRAHLALGGSNICIRGESFANS